MSRAAFDLLHADSRIDATALRTVGQKGWDGFILGVVRGAETAGKPGQGGYAPHASKNP